MAIKIFVILRVLMGGLFILSGFEKLVGPYQNFLYVVQSYAVLNTFGEELVARFFPWIELLLGVFLMFGLWLKWALRGVILLIVVFMAVVGQAIVRNLPIDECGCFGELISFPLHVTIVIDSALLVLAGVLARSGKLVSHFSLDRYFE